MKDSLKLLLALLVLFLANRETKAGGFSIVMTSTNEKGMIDSTIELPGVGAFKKARFTFNGVIQNFNLDGGVSDVAENEEKDIVGVNIKQATKQNTVYLIILDKHGGMRILVDVNEKIRRLFSPSDTEIDPCFIYIRAIKHRLCRMGSTVYHPLNPSGKHFDVLVDDDGDFKLVGQK